MEILFEALYVVDCEQSKVEEKEIPSSFRDYISLIIPHLLTIGDMKKYKTKTLKTEVINIILNTRDSYLQKEKNEEEIFKNNSYRIAEKLRNVEEGVQKRIAKMNSKVRKGTFIQVFYKEQGKLFYFLAKTPHNRFYDESDYSVKKGFQMDKLNIWRYCVFDISDTNGTEYSADVFTDTNARHWPIDFLELEEIASDEINTELSFNSVYKILKDNIDKSAPHDFMVLRNDFIHYYRSNSQINYSKMIEDVFKNYIPSDIEKTKYDGLIKKLEVLPQRKGFDTQFYCVKDIIKAKIKTTINIQEGLQLNISTSFNDIRKQIYSEVHPNGEMFLVIKTTNETVVKQFKK